MTLERAGTVLADGLKRYRGAAALSSVMHAGSDEHVTYVFKAVRRQYAGHFRKTVMPACGPYFVCVGLFVSLSFWPASALAQDKRAVRLEVPQLSAAMLAGASEDASASTTASAPVLPSIPLSQDLPARGGGSKPPIKRGRLFAINLIGSFGAGLTAAGAFHIVRAEPRASGCHYSDDEAVREEQMRRTGWALIGVGSTLVMGALIHWTVAQLQHRAPPLKRGERVALGLSPIGVGAVSAAFLWVGTIFRSLDCFNS